MITDFQKKLPNWLTIGRAVAVAPVILLLLADLRSAAFVLLVAAAITDFFDGWLARRWNAGSAFGVMLDPIADKLLVGGLLLALIAAGDIARWSLIPALAIQLREILVSGLREGGVSLPVTYLAKWKTTVQLVAVALLVAGIEPYATASLWIAAALTVWTGYGYLKASIHSAG
ncbi:CDP-diacylglycerol--glycerol-3-phosphate 3-phosphatidyltransferase [Roseiterribacter gracilis]|uniref:CDP-diacylglycerol--glycerol-3-phosphate 3-phosphatidyltransferase n=1 Tax=Roseiterribacter gracilis TaxID=2812848 RepID=A0A8S8XDT2_9PROT|nr:CDP-diacylglycerol--glycerol-3-phosphate 3-phosphatidyltransferase [Rhodospirillales bacterium TMPK1]